MSEPLALVRPKLSLSDSYRGLVAEFRENGEKLIPFPLQFPHHDFHALISKLEANSQGVGLPAGFVANTTFWLVRDNSEVMGVSNLRHELTDRLRIEGGHIGYGIRPSQRRRGFGSAILRLTLEEAKNIGLSEVLITCDKKNAASAATISKNGGTLGDEEFVEDLGKVVQRYWITLQ
ncbi:MAG: GNAT family N-acetyltransferase [Planctomycetes bacterium]|nr:GNAT family N-acetyltransferase [Planctomycetota bacterium]